MPSVQCCPSQNRCPPLWLIRARRTRRACLPSPCRCAARSACWRSLTNLGVALQAVAQSVQQLGDHRVADAVAQTVERHRQRPCALARPPQRRVGIAGGGRLDQRIQIDRSSVASRSIARLRPPPTPDFASGGAVASRPRRSSGNSDGRARRAGCVARQAIPCGCCARPVAAVGRQLQRQTPIVFRRLTQGVPDITRRDRSVERVSPSASDSVF